ncbi:uncharacterized protein LODBEIA_P20290 [Lodderomyces beijingensis]|uniref:PIH1 N-terminal domain-containing protein n=1 Tax=Lodderomyces beijingensis TaxID=1775926 RepID=A0ABP0ZKS4_9ASCO
MSLIDVNDKVTLHPKPGFVVKTKILECKDASRVSTKVFINICHDEQVPKPSVEFEASVVFPMIMENQWEIPLVVSREKSTADKKGFPSLVYDCCINSQCFTWCQVSKDLRLILVEWCIESVELIYSVVLERDYSVPKMLSKGELTETEITRQELAEVGMKKLQDMKRDETSNLVVDLRVMDEGEKEEEKEVGSEVTLSDLLNRAAPTPKKKKKKLIDEIDSVPERVYQPKPHKPGPTRINYEITFRKINKDYKMCIIIDTKPVDPAKFEATYSSSRAVIVIKSLDPQYIFPQNELVVPISHEQVQSSKDLRCFCCDCKLFIFV